MHSHTHTPKTQDAVEKVGGISTHTHTHTHSDTIRRHIHTVLSLLIIWPVTFNSFLTDKLFGETKEILKNQEDIKRYLRLLF